MNNYTKENRPVLLDRFDTVEFTWSKYMLRYTVEKNHLYCGVGNDAVFKALGLDKLEFSTKSYGYSAKGNGGTAWPECSVNDYAALTKLVNDLFNKIDGGRTSIINSNTNQNGKAIKTERPVAKISRGSERRGCTVFGKHSRTSTTVGHLSYRKIIG